MLPTPRGQNVSERVVIVVAVREIADSVDHLPVDRVAQFAYKNRTAILPMHNNTPFMRP